MGGLEIFKVFGTVMLNDKASEGLDKVDKKAAGFDQKMKELGEGMSKVGDKLTKNVTLPIIGLGTAAVVTVSGFDDSMSRVQAITGATGEELNKLREMAKKLGAETRYSAAQASDGMTYLAMAGWSTNEILGAMPGLLSLASAGNLGLAESADITSNVMSMFRIEATRATQVADILAKGANIANTDVTLLGEAMKYAGSSAAVAGMDLEQTVAVLDALANAGIKGGMAGTTFNAMMRDLKSAAEGGTIAIGNHSIAVYDQTGRMRDLTSIMADLEVAFDGLTDAQRDAYMSTIFQEQSLKGANIVFQTGTKRIREFEDALYNCNGAALEMSTIMEGNVGGAFRELKSAAEGVAIEFGEVMAPVIIDLIKNTINPLLNSFAALSPEVKESIVKFGLFAAASGPVIKVVGNLSSGIGGAVGMFKKLGSGITNLVSNALPNMGFGLASLSSQIGSIAAAAGPIALLVAAIGGLTYAVVKHVKDVSTPLTNYRQQFEETLAGVNADIANNLDNLVSESRVRLTTLKDETAAILLDMTGESATATEEMKNKVLENIEAMKQESINKLNEDKEMSLALLREKWESGEFINLEHYQKEKAKLEEHYNEKIVETESKYNKMNETILQKMVEQGRITEEQYNAILGIFNDFTNEEEILERERQAQKILLQREMNEIMEDTDKKSKEELIKIFDDFRNEEIRRIEEEHREKTEKLTKYFKETGNMTEEEYKKELEKYDQHAKEQYRAVEGCLNELYLENKDYFDQLKLVYDEGLGEIRKKVITDNEEYMQSLAKRHEGGITHRRDFYKQLEEEHDKHTENIRRRGYQTGQDLVDGYSRGIDENRWKAVNSAKALASTTQETLRGTLKIESPSKVMMEIGENVTEGLIEGIVRGKDKIDMSLEDLFNQSIRISSTVKDAPKKSETFNFTGDIIIPVNELKEFNDVLDFFKHIGKERVARGLI